MKIQLLSDVHIEHADYQFQDGGADVIICAGDIGVGISGLKWIETRLPTDRPILYVTGNHEYYRYNLHTLTAELKASVMSPHIHIMDKDVFIHNGVRFLGCTLWTDCLLDGTQEVSKTFIERCLADYYLIQKYTEEDEVAIISAADTIEMHHDHLNFLSHELLTKSGADYDATVVLTHHAPSPKSIHSKYEGSHINAGFASNLNWLLETGAVQLWVHGHMHDPFDYKVGDCRVVCNPRGYPTEDNGFDDRKILEVPTPKER